MNIRFVSAPNLPAGRAAALLLGEAYLDALTPPLTALGISVLPVPVCKKLQKAEQSHIDLIVHHLGKNRLVVQRDCVQQLAFLKQLGFELIPAQTEVSSQYPYNIGLNLASIGSFSVHNFRYTDPGLLRMLSVNTVRIHVKQGYSRCSVCIVKKDAIITEDSGIHAAVHTNMDCLLIRPGHIRLKGHPYGFIGGASAKLSDDTLAFTGTLDHHPDRAEIFGFYRVTRLLRYF